MEQVGLFAFNGDWRRRNTVLRPFLRTDGPFAQLADATVIVYFQDMPVEVVAQLLEERFLDPDERQNDSPSSSEFFAFMRRHPGVLAHGYAIGIEREDYRVTIEGVSYRGAVSEALRLEAKRVFGSADEFRVEPDSLYVWFD